MDGLPAQRAPEAAGAALAATAFVAAGVAAATGSGAVLALAAALLVAAPLAMARELPWRLLLGALVLVIVFIPIRRYDFDTGLPIQLEPYRVLVALLLGGWFLCLLVDERVKLRRTGFEAPMLAIGAAAFGSVVVNPERAAAAQPEVIKALSFLASFLLVFFLIANVVRGGRDVHAVLKTLVAGMAVVGALATVERRTGWSPFAHLATLFPLLHESADDAVFRGAGLRARGPAEHPIALGAVLVLCVPIAFYLAMTARKRLRWWGALAALSLGALATLSRTGILMLASVALVYLWLRRSQTARLWPLLIPFVAVVHFAAPGTLGSLKSSFFPQGGLIAQQRADQGDCDASGRIADIAPTIREVSRSPLLGVGFGTRVVSGEKANACILDDQWLATLLDSGILGLLAWLWLFVLLIRRLSRAASRAGADGDLAVALLAAIASFALGMFTFDAFGFIQVTFVLFMLMAIAAATLAQGEPDAAPPRVA